MYRHVLAIGCTGMLLAASVALARRTRVLTSIAHTERSLRQLDCAITGAGCIHHTLALDWSQPIAFCAALAAHVRAAGDADLVLAWLHATELGSMVAEAVAPSQGRCRFFQVCGSATADPLPRQASGFDPLPGVIDYHRIVLGFHSNADGSRWLRDDEICAGVLAAIAQPQAVTTIGSTTPWANRPR